MEKLKVFSAYLPFELKGIRIDKLICELKGILKNQIIWGLELEDVFDESNNIWYDAKNLVKPILFSLEDLTKPITIGGKEIIAIDYISTSITNRQRILRRVSNNQNLDVLEYWKFERLLELKFNVFNLPEDEYVKVTDSFNPYE